MSRLTLAALLTLAACDVPPEGLPPDDQGQVESELTTGMRIGLVAENGKLVSVGEDGKLRSVAGRLGANETFKVTKVADGVIAFQAHNGKFVAAESGGGSYLIANREVALGWERFRVAHYPGWKISLRANAGQYVRTTASGVLEAVAARPVLFTIRPAAEIDVKKQFGLSGVHWINAGLPESGAQMVRTEFRWDSHQPTPGDTLNGKLNDNFVNAANAAGVKVLGLLLGIPQWARGSGCAGVPDDHLQHCAPDDAEGVAAFGKFAGLLARHYKTLGVHDWEILNEVNSSYFYEPKPDPARYARLLVAAYRAMKAEDPDANVIMGSTCGNGVYNPAAAPDPRFMDPRVFLTGVYSEAARLGLKHPFDAVSHHPYTWSNIRRAIEDAPNWNLMYQDTTFDDGTPLKSLRTLMIEAGDGDKPIDVTEWGVPAPIVMNDGATVITEDMQAATIETAMDLWKTYPWARGFYVFDYKDMDSSQPNDLPKYHQHHMGLIRSYDGVPGCTATGAPTGTAKKAYCMFSRYPKE